ncbi:MAG: flagellar basal body P-ring formation protein FlgA [Deltaproteobacteria bacterium]|nr:flagellar basal body P-ring formation protein FlgA [Deltaproteobacteria bacterium]
MLSGARRHTRLVFWLVLLLLISGAPAPVRAAAADPVPAAVLFRAQAQVAGDYITLAHLAALPPDLQQKCGQALVWSAPPPGQVYTLTREFLEYRLGQLGLADLLELGALPAAIQVQQTGVLLSGEEVAGAYRRFVKERSQWPAANLHIQVFPLEEPVILPDHQVTLEFLPPKGGRFLGEVPLELVILRRGQPLKRLKVCGKVTLERQVVCATRPLKPRDVIAAEDVQLLKREISDPGANDFFVSLDQVVGQTAGRPVGPQEIITSRHLSRTPVIKRGDEVTVILDQDGLVISTKGLAREEGYLGRPIRMLNPRSKKEFTAQVVDAKTVQVKL